MMLGYSKSATVAFLHLFLLVLGPVHAAPAPLQSRAVNTSVRLARDGDDLSQSTTVQVTNVLQTSVGPMLQTCTIELDPITGDNGEPLVRETSSCTLAMTSSGNNASGNDGSNSSSSSDTGATATSSTDSSAATSAAATDGSSTDSTGATATATDGSSTDSTGATATATDTSAPTATSGGAIGVDGTSLVPGSSLSTGATDTAVATATGTDSASASQPTGGAISPNGFSSVDASQVATESIASGTSIVASTATGASSASAAATGASSASATATGTSAADAAAGSPSSVTSAADQAQSSTAKFQLPGTKLSVLPIGLGVFAGISVIALIVVGLVTYERTKYRKAFRQRKLAESGANMGYGGMAQAA